MANNYSAPGFLYIERMTIKSRFFPHIRRVTVFRPYVNRVIYLRRSRSRSPLASAYFYFIGGIRRFTALGGRSRWMTLVRGL